MCFAKTALNQTYPCMWFVQVLKKYQTKCLSVRDAVTSKSYSKTLTSESILKLLRILCFWLKVSTQEKLQKHCFISLMLTRVTDRQSQRHGQTKSASRRDKWRFCHFQPSDISLFFFSLGNPFVFHVIRVTSLGFCWLPVSICHHMLLIWSDSH